MKKVHIFHFSKAYIPAVTLSVVIIVSGLIAYALEGFNLGVDFRAGINQSVQLAYPAMDVSYAGKGNADLSVTDKALTVVFSGAEVDNKTVMVDFATATTVDAVAASLRALPDITVTLRGDGGIASTLLVQTFQGNNRLGSTPYTLHNAPVNDGQKFATTEKVRACLADLGEVAVQDVTPASLQRYVIRVQDKGKDVNFSKTAPAAITADLERAFGADRVVIMKTDYVGASYSEGLTKQSFWLVLATIFVILIYCTIRFRFQYGIGAVLSTVHDALIMVAFVVFTRMEFNTSTIAAILTILGYSINDTIVQYDRIREDRKLKPNEKFRDVLDTALSETLGRTIITTGVTLITVFALVIFTRGSMQDFAKCLIVGMISGSYSTVFIASAFVLAWENISDKKKAKAMVAQSAQKISLSKKPAPVAKAVPDTKKKGAAE